VLNLPTASTLIVVGIVLGGPYHDLAVQRHGKQFDVETICKAPVPTQLRDRALPAQAIQHNPDLLLGRKPTSRLATNILYMFISRSIRPRSRIHHQSSPGLR